MTDRVNRLHGDVAGPLRQHFDQPERGYKRGPNADKPHQGIAADVIKRTKITRSTFRDDKRREHESYEDEFRVVTKDGHVMTYKLTAFRASSEATIAKTIAIMRHYIAQLTVAEARNKINGQFFRMTVDPNDNKGHIGLQKWMASKKTFYALAARSRWDHRAAGLMPIGKKKQYALFTLETGQIMRGKDEHGKRYNIPIWGLLMDYAKGKAGGMSGQMGMMAGFLKKMGIVTQDTLIDEEAGVWKTLDKEINDLPKSEFNERVSRTIRAGATRANAGVPPLTADDMDAGAVNTLIERTEMAHEKRALLSELKSRDTKDPLHKQAVERVERDVRTLTQQIMLLHSKVACRAPWPQAPLAGLEDERTAQNEAVDLYRTIAERLRVLEAAPNPDQVQVANARTALNQLADIIQTRLLYIDQIIGGKNAVDYREQFGALRDATHNLAPMEVGGDLDNHAAVIADGIRENKGVLYSWRSRAARKAFNAKVKKALRDGEFGIGGLATETNTTIAQLKTTANYQDPLLHIRV